MGKALGDRTKEGAAVILNSTFFVFSLLSVMVNSKTIESNDQSTIQSEMIVKPTFDFKKGANEKAVGHELNNQKVDYPRVILFRGASEVLGKEHKPLTLKKDLELKESAVIRTKGDGEIAISLGRHRKLVVMPNSEVSIPSIGWETGEVPLITIKNGAIFWQDFLTTDGVLKKNYDVALTSGLFQFIAPQADFVLYYFPKLPRAEVRVVRGEMVFSAMNAERSVSLTAGEKVEFFGALDGSEIAYDILLKGKKIPRGQLAEKSRFDVAEFLPTLIPEKPKEDPQVVEARRKQAERKKIDETRGGKFICIKPRGQLNQCLWRFEKGNCYRYRCNANGDWAEGEWIRTNSLCQREPRIAQCDY